MNREQLQSILDRVREATGPDRELDGSIDAVLRAGLPSLPAWAWENFPEWKHISNGRVCVLHDSGEHGLNWSSQPATASIDAALALTERVLPINSTRLVSDPSGCSCAITWWPDGLTGETRVQSSEAQVSLSLAILAATLSALLESGRLK